MTKVPVILEASPVWKITEIILIHLLKMCQIKIQFSVNHDSGLGNSHARIKRQRKDIFALKINF